MSLQTLAQMMSKSDSSAKATVFLTDNDQTVKKIKSAVTATGTEVAYDWENKPGVSNLLKILSHFTGRSIDDLASEYRSGGYGNFKTAVAEAVSQGVAPVREAYEGMTDAEVVRVMSESAEQPRCPPTRPWLWFGRPSA